MTSSHTHLPSSLYRAQYRHEARPLIDQVTNAWQHSEKYDRDSSDDEDDNDDDDYKELQHCCDLDSDASFIRYLRALFDSRKFRRTMIASLLAFVIFYFVLNVFVLPAYRQRQELIKGLDDTTSFGQETPGKFDDITQVQELAAEYIPGGTADPDGKRRLIFIGDIHGCKHELLDLLKTVNFDKEYDKIIATGDVIAKGPDSPGVVNTLMSLDALSVRGNHEDRILLAAKSHLRSADEDSVKSANDSTEDLSTSPNGAGLKGEALLPYFKRRQFTYLKSFPLILHIPALTPLSHPAPGLASHKSKKKHHFLVQNDINVVHAGLVPSVPLLRQDPFSVMNMRSMSPSNHVPSEDRKKGIPWERVWGWYNDRLDRTRSSTFLSWLFGQATEPKDASQWWRSWDRIHGVGSEDSPAIAKHPNPSVVVYGHDSPRKLNLKPWSKGLDGGCVGGGQLHAMVLNAWGQAEIFSVDCKHRK